MKSKIRINSIVRFLSDGHVTIHREIDRWLLLNSSLFKIIKMNK